MTLLALLTLAACSDDSDRADAVGQSTGVVGGSGTTSSPTTTGPQPAAGTFRKFNETFVDASRATKGQPRTLVTTLRIPDAKPGEPKPLVVFAHGLGSDLTEYSDLLDAWAAAGYVVAAPLFPYTNKNAPGGPEATDYVNQPGDLRFVIDNLLTESSAGGTLKGLIDPKAIAVAGHSNGGITAYGVAANTCCRDPRVAAVIILAGNPQPFGDKAYDYASNAPTLVVHGTADAQMPYNPSAEAFNKMRAPKVFVSLTDAQHGEWLRSADKNFATTVGATTAFLRAQLGGAGISSRTFDALDTRGAVLTVATDAASPTVATLPKPGVKRVASVNPDNGLKAGQQVTVTWSGFLPGQSVNVLQCAPGDAGSAASCDLQKAKLLLPNPTGSGSVTFTILDGPVGNGVCGVDNNTCVIRVNDSGLLEPEATLALPISFGA